MRKALLVGINHYDTKPLSGCINDAENMAALLATHFGGEKNFETDLLTSTAGTIITDGYLRGRIKKLFKEKVDSALFFFSGHGVFDDFGGYLMTQDATQNDKGVAFVELIDMANKSKIPEIIIILDCCHAGGMGNWNPIGAPTVRELAIIREGVSILSSSRDNEYSKEISGKGMFTALVCEALEGGAADIYGHVTVAGVYAFAEKLFDSFEQRPMFKSHASQFSTLRQCEPKLENPVLKNIIRYFPTADANHDLSPAYEPTAKPVDEEKQAIFAELQKMTQVGLVVPVGEKHMYYAAMNEKSCQLTPSGKYYWRRVKNENP